MTARTCGACVHFDADTWACCLRPPQPVDLNGQLVWMRPDVTRETRACASFDAAPPEPPPPDPASGEDPPN